MARAHGLPGRHIQGDAIAHHSNHKRLQVPGTATRGRPSTLLLFHVDFQAYNAIDLYNIVKGMVEISGARFPLLSASNCCRCRTGRKRQGRANHDAHGHTAEQDLCQGHKRAPTHNWEADIPTTWPNSYQKRGRC